MSYLNHEDQYAIARKFTAYWTADRLGEFRAQCSDVMDRMPSELWDRDKQKFCPLFALAEQAGNGWPEKIAQASLATLTQPDLAPLSLSQRAMRDAGFVVERELADKAEHKATVLLTKNQRDFIATDALIKTMLVLPEAPWRSYGPSKKILDANGLYHFLKCATVPPKVMAQHPKVAAQLRLSLPPTKPQTAVCHLILCHLILCHPMCHLWWHT